MNDAFRAIGGHTQYTLRMSPQEAAHVDALLHELRNQPRAPRSATALLRQLIDAIRSLFWLPAYQREALHQDMRERGLDTFSYLQELLAKRYEELRRRDSGVRGGGK